MSVPLFFTFKDFFNWDHVLIVSDMLMIDLRNLVSTARDRVAALQGVAELLRNSGAIAGSGFMMWTVPREE